MGWSRTMDSRAREDRRIRERRRLLWGELRCRRAATTRGKRESTRGGGRGRARLRDSKKVQRRASNRKIIVRFIR